MINNVSGFLKISTLFVTGCSLIYPNYTIAKGRYICATVTKMLEPSDDAAYFKVSGNFTLKDNKEKILGYYMWGDEKKRNKDTALIDSSLKKMTKIYILIDDSESMVEGVESKCR
ncbi:MAG: hypothetical protein V9G18_22180 [Albidovulum sp.]